MSNRLSYITPKRSLAELNAAQQREADLQAMTEAVFVQAATAQQLDDAVVAKFPTAFIVWDENWRGKAGDIVQDEGACYRSIHDVTDAGQNRKPSENSSDWARIGDPGEEWPEWLQPGGPYNAYHIGDKVTHKGKRWVCTETDGAGNNTWEPGVYGWTEYTEPEVAQEAADGPEEALEEETQGEDMTE